MAKIAFIGLGHMGGGMAPNLAKAGHEVRAFDLSEDALAHAVERGCTRAGSTDEAVKGADAVVTMLPAGKHVAEVYRSHIFAHAPKSAILIDCSTIDVATARSARGRSRGRGIHDGRCPGVRRDCRCRGRNPDLHGRRLGRRLRKGPAVSSRRWARR